MDNPELIGTTIDRIVRDAVRRAEEAMASAKSDDEAIVTVRLDAAQEG